MKIEVRKSGGPVCEHCGATELVVSPRSNEALEADLVALFAKGAAKLERELLDAFEAGRDEALERKLEDARAAYLKRLSDALGDRVPAVRFVKRRWQTEMEESLRSVMDELRLEMGRV